jgi:hypothetical protein
MTARVGYVRALSIACWGALPRRRRSPHGDRRAAPRSEALAGERTLAAWTRDERKPEQRRQLGDVSLQHQDLLPKLRLCPLRFIETDDGARRATKPPTCRRSRDAAPRGKAEFARASDEFPEPMVITLLRADRSGHARSSLRGQCAKVTASADLATTRAAACRMSWRTALVLVNLDTVSEPQLEAGKARRRRRSTRERRQGLHPVHDLRVMVDGVEAHVR